MKTIKTRETAKGIKTLDRAGNLAERSKNSFVRTKGRAEETQDSRNSSPSEYAANSVEEKAGNAVQAATSLSPGLSRKNEPAARKQAAGKAGKTAHNAKENAVTATKAANEANKAAAESKAAVKAAKSNYQKTRQSGRQAVQSAKQKYKVEKSNLYNKNSTVNYTKKNSTKNMRHSARGFKNTAKGSVKVANKSVKSARRAVKTARHTAKTAGQAAAAARKSAFAARMVARRSIWIARLTIIGILKMMKLAILAVKKLVAAIVVGGKVALAVILIIVLIGGVLGSAFGIFFSDEESPDSGWTVRQAIAQIDIEFNERIDEIISSNEHDVLEISGVRAAWRNVLAVYAVRTATDPDNPMEVATMDDEKFELLRAIFWDMNSISHYIDTHEEEIDVLDDNGDPTGETETITVYTLHIVVDYMGVDEITAEYGFTDEQIEWLEELLLPEHMGLWNALLFGVTSGVGSAAMVEVALSQLGNIGGEIYWRWYGFGERQPWCAIFVSWVAEQNGFIQSGAIPMFASTSVGMQWFQSRGLWQPRGYTPAPGDLIFFDRTGSGTPDHVGIVERVENGVVHTIEGNSSDMVRRRSYPLDNVTILGYGVPMY